MEALVLKVIQREWYYWNSWNWDNGYGQSYNGQWITFGYDLGTTPPFVFWTTFIDTFWSDINTTVRTAIEAKFEEIVFNFRRLYELQLVRKKALKNDYNLMFSGPCGTETTGLLS